MAKESHLQGGRPTAGSLAKQGRFPSGTLETAREDACAPEANNTFAVGAFFSSQLPGYLAPKARRHAAAWASAPGTVHANKSSADYQGFERADTIRYKCRSSN